MTSQDDYERGFRAGADTGRREGEHAGFGDGYDEGFDVGVEVGGARVLLAIEHVLGRELLDAMWKASEGRLAHFAEWVDYRRRTTYEAVPGRPEWRGTEAGDSVEQWVARREVA